jgi:hypothetical protein
MYLKYGFKVLAKVGHEEFVNENGEQIVHADDGVTNCGMAMIYELR